jgi:hypothetical protein
VYLTPDFNSGGTGSLSYSISFPSTVSRAFFALYPLDAPGTKDAPGTSRENAISAGAGGTAVATLTNLAAGSYLAVIDLYDGAGNKAAVRTEAVHIYGGLTSTLNRSIAGIDFAVCPPVVGTGETTLAAKLNAALALPEGAYTIVLDGSETDLASFAPKTLTVTGNKDITITIRGNGGTVQPAGSGNLFTLSPDPGSSLKLVLQDMTLRGLSSNTGAIVRVNSGATLRMKAGTLITGNSSSSGGGVSVADGTFIVSGGAVSGNTGGGVSVSSGTLTMSGGMVSGNTSSTYGGGVSVGSGTLIMSGGTVSGNTAPSGGGVYSSGTIIMSGGAVRNNTLSGEDGFGREVVSDGTFRISGEARPERVFLYNNTRYITISGPLSGGPVPIDLGVTSSASLADWENKGILSLDLDTFYGGNLASLKDQFTLGNYTLTESPYTETAIPTGTEGYKISDTGYFVTTQ